MSLYFRNTSKSTDAADINIILSSAESKFKSLIELQIRRACPTYSCSPHKCAPQRTLLYSSKEALKFKTYCSLTHTEASMSLQSTQNELLVILRMSNSYGKLRVAVHHFHAPELNPKTLLVVMYKFIRFRGAHLLVSRNCGLSTST